MNSSLRLLVILCCLPNQFSSLYNPFTIEHEGPIYKSRYSERKTITIITFNKSTISINLGDKKIEKFSVTESNNDLKLKIYTSADYPQLTDSVKILKMKVFCEFSYPVTVFAGSDSYMCSLEYKDKSGQSHLIGQCQLTLQYKSTICLLIGSINSELLTNKRGVVFSGSVHHCDSQCSTNTNNNWKRVVNTSLTVALVSLDHVIWMTSFVKKSMDIVVLIGVPKNPINKSTNFEIPIKLHRRDANQQIAVIHFQVSYNEHLTVDDVLPVGCFQIVDFKSFEDKKLITTEIEISRDDSVQCLNGDLDILFILQMSAKEEANYLKIQVSVENIGFKNNITMRSFIHEKAYIQHSVTIPLFHGKHTIIPVFNNPVIFPNIKKHHSPYVFTKSEMKVYFVYDETQFVDVSARVQCRPFDNSMLTCPSNMQPLIPFLTTVDNLDSVKYSLELMIDGLLLILSVKPLMEPDNQWVITITDSVLNLITGWNGPRNKPGSVMASDGRCEPIFQVAQVHIYKKVFFNDLDTNQTNETTVDMSDDLDLNNIKVTEGIAKRFKSRRSIIVQGIQSGNLDLELLANDDTSLLKRSMTVYNESVSIIDLDVSCISDVQITHRVTQSLSSIRIADLHFNYQNFNGSHSCFLMIDVMFSDKSQTNVVMFPTNQYRLRLITKMKIIEVFDVSNIWYNYEEFNRETSFYVELQESNLCKNPKTIFKKRVQVDIYTALISVGEKKMSTNSDISNPQTLKNIIYLLVVIVSVVLVIIIINILVKYFISQKHSKHHSARRKLSNGLEISTLQRNERNYPPLLPPPGPQVHLTDDDNVTISSPHSFWCHEPNKSDTYNCHNPLPMNGTDSRGLSDKPPCTISKMTDNMKTSSPNNNLCSSQEVLSNCATQDSVISSPISWLMTQNDLDGSSGVGSLITTIDDTIKDPYGSLERFQKLSHFPLLHFDVKEDIYDSI